MFISVRWFDMGPTGATRDLWVRLAGPTAPEYGVWKTPSGKPVHEILATEGPPGVQDVEWYFMPYRDHYGKRLVDAVWQYGDGLKVYSERMCAVLESCGARLQTWPADVRFEGRIARQGISLGTGGGRCPPDPVHSLRRGRRTGRVVISGEVRKALLAAGMTGLEILEADSAFPRDIGSYSGSD